jgi:serine/threonine protein kinase
MMPYYAHGTVVRYLKQHPETSTTQRICFSQDIARGISYLHGRNVIHGDLKGDNVLVDMNLQCVITDFGMSVVKTASMSTQRKTQAIRWIAPERHSRGYTISKPLDVFAYAMTVYEIFSGLVPFQEEVDDMIVMQWIRDGERPDQGSIPDSIWSFLQPCWHPQSASRPTFETITQQLQEFMLEQGDPRPKQVPRLDSGVAPSQPGFFFPTDSGNVGSDEVPRDGVPMQAMYPTPEGGMTTDLSRSVLAMPAPPPPPAPPVPPIPAIPGIPAIPAIVQGVHRFVQATHEKVQGVHGFVQATHEMVHGVSGPSPETQKKMGAAERKMHAAELKMQAAELQMQAAQKKIQAAQVQVEQKRKKETVRGGSGSEPGMEQAASGALFTPFSPMTPMSPLTPLSPLTRATPLHSEPAALDDRSDEKTLTDPPTPPALTLWKSESASTTPDPTKDRNFVLDYKKGKLNIQLEGVVTQKGGKVTQVLEALGYTNVQEIPTKEEKLKLLGNLEGMQLSGVLSPMMGRLHDLTHMYHRLI